MGYWSAGYCWETFPEALHHYCMVDHQYLLDCEVRGDRVVATVVKGSYLKKIVYRPHFEECGYDDKPFDVTHSSPSIYVGAVILMAASIWAFKKIKSLLSEPDLR